MSARNLMVKKRPPRRKTVKPANDAVAGTEHTHGRWSCHHRLDGSDIEAYIAETGGLEVIAQTCDVEGADAQANAERIVRAVNAYETTQPLITELAAALELCLACEGLSPAARQEAEFAIRRAKKLTGSITA